MNNLIRMIGNFVRRNSTTILTVAGSVGVVGTAVLAVKATKEAYGAIYASEMRNNMQALTKKEVFLLTWDLYIPTAIMGITTISCIIGTNNIHVRRGAALTSMYTMADTALKEYKDKVIEQFGTSKEKKVREEIAQDHVKANKPSKEVLIMADGKVLCYDSLSGRYFHSDFESIRKAVNDINEQCINTMSASLNNFYSLVGLDPTALGDEMGWNTDRLLEIDPSAILTDDNRPCIHLDYRLTPMAGYDDLH